MSDALALLASLVLEDGRRWGAAAAPWQWEDARAFLEPGAGPRLHFLTRPRGGSKTSDTAGYALAALATQLPGGAQGYAVAADGDQAALLVDAAAGFVMRTPGLASLVSVERRRITAPSGASVNVLPADGASAFGLLPHVLFVDELAQWKSTREPRRVWEAVVSAVPKVPGCRLVVLTSAGDPAHWSAKVLEGAQGSRAWRVHEVPGPVPWISSNALDEQRRLLTDSQFARLHMNEWTAPEDRLATLDDVRACIGGERERAPVPGVRYVAGLDLGVKSDRTVLAVCHAVRDGERTTVVLDRMQCWEPRPGAPVSLGEVEAAVLQCWRSYRARVVVDPWQALAMIERLRRAGVRISEFTFSSGSVGRLASVLYRLIRDRALVLPDDEALIDELAHVRLVESTPGVVRLDHDPDRHDDRAIALALAAHALLEGGPRRRMRFHPTPDRRSRELGGLLA